MQNLHWSNMSRKPEHIKRYFETSNTLLPLEPYHHRTLTNLDV